MFKLSAQAGEKCAALLADTQLQPHQQRIAESGQTLGTRLLLYHDLGSGKTLSALAAAEQAGKPYTAIVPAALRPNLEKERKKFTDQTLPYAVMSYTGLGQKRPVPYRDTLLFDEVHHLRNPAAKQTREAFRQGEYAKNVYLLSGSPIVNSPHDLIPLIRLLTGKNYSAQEFEQEFIGQQRFVAPGSKQPRKPIYIPVLKNPEKLKELLRGHVDYHKPADIGVQRTEERVAVRMSPEQAKIYRAFFSKIPRNLQQKLSEKYPLTPRELQQLTAFLSGPRQVSLSTLPFQATPEALDAFDTSAKLQAALKKRLEAGDVPAVVASNFIQAGLLPYAAALQRLNHPYGVLHGGLSDKERKRLVEEYNQGKLRTLLLGPAGTEGISLKGTRLLQILDPHFHNTRGQQTVGRGIRFDSHTDLPLADRNVLIQRFIARQPPRGLFGAEQAGMDEHLEHIAEQKERLNRQFLHLLQQIGSTKA